MVKIMPAFTHVKKCHKPIVSTVIIGNKWLITHHMTEGINSLYAMEKQGSAQEKSTKILSPTHEI
jgi:hypothetical protein